jgi:hypothetical protein
VAYPEDLKNAEFAFDGTVMAAEPLRTHDYLVTFRVNEWFRPAGGGEVKVRMSLGPDTGSDDPNSESGQRYSIGSRLLISGASLSGAGGPLKDPVAWGCGFSRTYDTKTAATWRKVFPK